uniref:DUF4054 domain-containing protein n=1 Tax=viral metagenome TaxID=1070528 RepID=A0A6M3M5Q7_9ZZZZ
MAFTTLQIFRIVASEFSATADADVENWIELAASRHSGSQFGSNYEQAMAYYTAHMMTIQARAAASPASAGGGGAPVGGVTSQKAGDISVGYGGAAAGGSTSVAWDRVDASLTQTGYGLEYLTIRGTRAVVFPYMSEAGGTS